MDKIPVLGFSGYSNSGKTTLIEKLVVSLKKRGFRIAVIKHHGHEGLEIDIEKKDSWRFAKAGADITIVNSPNKTAFIEERSLEFQQLIDMVHDVNLILVEGFKKEPIAQIGVCRAATNKGFPSEFKRYIGIVTDRKDIETNLPKFDFEQVDLLTDFIIMELDKGKLS